MDSALAPPARHRPAVPTGNECARLASGMSERGVALTGAVSSIVAGAPEAITGGAGLAVAWVRHSVSIASASLVVSIITQSAM